MEKLYFAVNNCNGENRKLFVHGLFNQDREGVFVLFLNSFMDRVGEFYIRGIQIEVARILHKNNINILHFDYYGTGDSEGELFEVDFNKTIFDIEFLIEHIKEKYKPKHIFLFGIRIGADIAMLVDRKCKDIQNLILLEPVVHGKTFYKSKKYILKSNHLMWELNPEFEIMIDGKPYEDFDGIPFSYELKSFLQRLNSDEIDIHGKNILLVSIGEENNNTFQVDMISDKRDLRNLNEKLKKDNRLKYIILNPENGHLELAGQLALHIVRLSKILLSINVKN